LLLLPAGFLIVLLLGSLVLEAVALHLRQRQLDDLADSIANDAAAVGFDIDAFRQSGEISIDADLAKAVVQPAIDISSIPDARPVVFTVVDGADPGVIVGLSLEHDYIIGGALLGGGPDTLSATGRAALVLSAP
jgi:hypothetical protein